MTTLEEEREAAEKGSAEAQLTLGFRLMEAASTANEVSEAVFWLRKAAEQNYEYTQVLLGDLYSGFNASGVSRHYFSQRVVGFVTQDLEEALNWYRRAADHGSSGGMFGIGKIYEHGSKTTPKNLVEAIRWYELAPDGGNSSAAYAAAAMHFDGNGVKRDYVAAAKLYRKIADGSWSTPAELRLAWMCENGKGVLKDIVEAHKWFNLAVEHMQMTVGLDEKALEKARQEAESGRSRVERAMTPAQIKEAWKRYEQWKDARRESTGA